MQIRTYLGMLLAVAVVIYAWYLAPLNFEVLVEERFYLSSETSVALYVALLAAFLIGFLPVTTLLFIRSLRRDLALRRERRRSREVESLDQRFRRALDLQADGQWSRAASELEVILTERPEDFVTLLSYGEVRRLQGESEEALSVHRRASVLYPQSIALLYQLAEDYDALGETQVAHEIRNRILRDFSGLGLRVLRRRRDAAMAAEEWDEAVRWHERVERLLRDGGDERALEREAGTSRGLTYQRGVMMLEKDRPADAAATFREILAAEPRFDPARIMLGEAELLQENREAAVDEWRRGFLETGSPVFLKRIEDHFIEEEEPARAIETFRGLIAQAEKDLLPRFFLGRLYYRLEMHDEALKMLEGLGERLDSSPTYHYLLGRIRQRRNDQRGAMARYLACLKRLEVSNATFLCRSCGAEYPDWQDRCRACGKWNAVDLDIREEQVSLEDLGLVDRPVWGGYDESGESQSPEAAAEEAPSSTEKPSS